MIDKAALLNTANPQDKVEIDAGVLLVRGLGRAEVLQMLALAEAGGPDAAEAFALEKGIVEPVFTADEITQWRAGPGDDIAKISDRIAELSGLVKGAQFRARAGVHAGGDRPVPVPDGVSPGDHSDPPRSGDE